MSGSGCCGNEGCGCNPKVPEAEAEATDPGGALNWTQDDHFFALARLASKNSTCVKTHTGVALAKNGQLISTSCNLCSPEGKKYGEAVEKCPREGMKTGTGYELCAPVHAEVMGCLNAMFAVSQRSPTQEVMRKFAGHLTPNPDEVRAAFTPRELEALNGATCYLAGHYWACDNCIAFLEAVGINRTEIKLDPTTSKETEERYKARGITKDVPPGSD